MPACSSLRCLAPTSTSPSPNALEHSRSPRIFILDRSRLCFLAGPQKVPDPVSCKAIVAARRTSEKAIGEARRCALLRSRSVRAGQLQLVLLAEFPSAQCGTDAGRVVAAQLQSPKDISRDDGDRLVTATTRRIRRLSATTRSAAVDAVAVRSASTARAKGPNRSCPARPAGSSSCATGGSTRPNGSNGWTNRCPDIRDVPFPATRPPRRRSRSGR